jgi:hypothetical protein
MHRKFTGFAIPFAEYLVFSESFEFPIQILIFFRFNQSKANAYERAVERNKNLRVCARDFF